MAWQETSQNVPAQVTAVEQDRHVHMLESGTGRPCGVFWVGKPPQDQPHRDPCVDLNLSATAVGKRADQH
jgi:hypothetical protein